MRATLQIRSRSDSPSAGWPRRRLLGRGSAALAAALTPALLAACAGAERPSRGGRRLAISNWPLNIDASSDGHLGSVDRFERATGIRVDYSEDLSDSQAFFARVRSELAAGRRIAQDIVVIPYWLADRMRRLGWLEPLPLQAIPNAANLVPALRRPFWDPQGRYTLPWQSGIAGIAYNRRSCGRELRRLEDLFAPDLRGRVAALSEMRDTIGLLMLADGQDPSRPTPAAAEGAFRRLAQARANGQIRAFTGNDYINDLLSGELKACMAWSGDVAQLALLSGGQPDLRFVVPESGGIRWVDVMVVPRRAQRLSEAAAWMNFVYEPLNAAQITAAVRYTSPVQGVAAVLEKDSATAALSRDALLFPDERLSRRLHLFGALDPRAEAQFEQRFAEIMAA